MSEREQDDLWGANWYPAEQHVEYESLIKIRPRLGNRSILIHDGICLDNVTFHVEGKELTTKATKGHQGKKKGVSFV
jgi:hypothetical protein